MVRRYEFKLPGPAAVFTGKIEDAMERDTFLAPDKAKEFGLIDEVVSNRPADESEDGGGGSENGKSSS